MEENIEEDLKILEHIKMGIKADTQAPNIKTRDISMRKFEAIDHILSDYKRVLKENEELTISNKEIDKECSRLEEKEVKLINENEHYKDLIYALKTYYDITEEDLEKCIKNDR